MVFIFTIVYLLFSEERFWNFNFCRVIRVRTANTTEIKRIFYWQGGGVEHRYCYYSVSTRRGRTIIRALCAVVGIRTWFPTIRCMRQCISCVTFTILWKVFLYTFVWSVSHWILYYCSRDFFLFLNLGKEYRFDFGKRHDIIICLFITNEKLHNNGKFWNSRH